ncbi:MAG: carboxypeptidase regulatory-like domain-containing protein [Bryobacterales bacterium]|nr:carboxypeptidase regulatory-like domain-containing protein [Bryobacterales bacterium]
MNGVYAAVLIASGAFTALSLAQNPQTGGGVEGTVVNSATGAGVGGAVVTFFAQANRYETTSDATGRFQIAGMAPGNYRSSARKDGFAPVDLNFFTDSGTRIGSDADPVKVVLKLAPLSNLRGRVVDPDGKPLAGVEVSFVPNLLGSVTSDHDGRFTIEEVRPGSYRLAARPAVNAKPLEFSDGTRVAMVTTYYPSVTDPSLSQKIEFRGDGDLSGYEIRMQTAPVLRVRGIVLNEDGTPSSGAEVSLLPNSESATGVMGLSMRAGQPSSFAIGVRPPPIGMPEATTATGPDGRFDLSAVRPGDWRISAESSSMRERGATTVRVRRSDVDDLEIRLAPRFNLTAAVEWKGEDPRPHSARILGAVTMVNSEGEFVRSGIEESGSLLFENVLPGQYRIIVGSGLSAQVLLGNAEVTNQVFPAIAGGPPLRVILQAVSGRIRGMVEQGGGATIVLIPQGAQRGVIGLTIQCAADGSFELSEVSPGDYYIAAFESPPNLGSLGFGLAPTPAMLSLVPARGTSVKIEEGSVTNVTLPLISVPK